MLYTIKQLKRRINSYIFNSINDVDNVVRGINESPNTGEYLKQNAQAIRDYINSLDTRKRDGIIYMNELAKPENKKALENILKALRLDSDHLIKIGVRVDYLTNILNEFVGEQRPIIAETKEQEAKLSVDYYRSQFKRTLKKGMTGDDVKLLQEFLSLKFALNGVKLGTFDDKTYQMLWAYQRNNGLKTDGEAGSKTFNKIALDMYENQKKNGFSVPTTVPTVAPVEQKETSNQSTNKTNETIIKEFGSQSEIYKKNKNKVIELQKALVALGYDLGKTGSNRDGVDGSYGEKTKKALEDRLAKISQKTEAGSQSSETTSGAGAEIKRILENYSAKGVKSTINIEPGKTSDTEKIAIITAVQKALKELGYYNGGITGTFLPKADLDFKKALKSFQNSEKITKDTLKKLADRLGVTVDETTNGNRSNSGEKPEKREGLRTIEETDGRIDITFGVGKENYAGLRENINNESFERIIKSMTFQQLEAFHKDIIDISNKHYKKGNEYVYNWGSIGKITDLFEKKYKYVPDGPFGGIEVASLVTLVEGIYKTQKEIHKTTNFKDKVGLVLDYDKNGFLDDDVHFYTEERQLFDAIENEKGFDNLLRNLGYDGKEDFYEKLDKNYLSARSDFKARIGRLLSVKNVLNPSEMIADPKAMEKFDKAMEKSRNTISKIVDGYSKTKDFPPETKNIVVNQIAAMVGSVPGAGIGIDISGVTNGLLDSLALGVVDGTPGIGFTKTLRSDTGRLEATIGVINLIPFIRGSVVLNEADAKSYYNEKLFPEKIKGNVQIRLTGTLSLRLGAEVSFDRITEKTKKGIERMKKEMEETLDKLKKDIVSNTPFEKSSVKDHKNDKSMYEGLLQMYNASGKNDAAWERLKEGALKNYETELYLNASNGINLAGFAVGFVGPFPYIGLTFETHSVDWHRVDTWGSTGTGNMVPTGIESPNNAKIRQELAKFESQFTPASRTKRGAKEYLNPDLSLNARWNGLLEFSKSIPGMTSFLNTIKENERQEVLDILVPLGRTSTLKDKSIEEQIAVDQGRSPTFDRILGTNIMKERKELYDKLRGAKGSISVVNGDGGVIDIVATLNVEGSRQKGLDFQYSNVSLLSIDGKKPALVPINSENTRKIIRKMRGMNIDPKVKNDYIAGLESGKYILQLGKDPYGFDDKIVITDKNGNPITGVRVYQPSFNTREWGIFGNYDTRKDDGGRVDTPDTPDDKNPPASGSDAGNATPPSGTPGNGSSNL